VCEQTNGKREKKKKFEGINSENVYKKKTNKTARTHVYTQCDTK
jgi:hypothetical protein